MQNNGGHLTLNEKQYTNKKYRFLNFRQSLIVSVSSWFHGASIIVNNSVITICQETSIIAVSKYTLNEILVLQIKCVSMQNFMFCFHLRWCFFFKYHILSMNSEQEVTPFFLSPHPFFFFHFNCMTLYNFWFDFAIGRCETLICIICPSLSRSLSLEHKGKQIRRYCLHTIWKLK